MQYKGQEVDLNALPRKAIRNRNLTALVLNNAEALGYDLIKIDYNTGLLRFEKEGVNINYYTTSKTVTTELNHPKKGKTQLHRKHLCREQVMEVFKTPRLHTGHGYYRKNS